MQDWLERIHGTLAQHLVQVLKLNAVHNRSALPPFRFAAIAQQFLATLKEFAGSRDGDAVRAVGRSLAEQGLGLRTVLALGRSLLDDALGRRRRSRRPPRSPPAASASSGSTIS